jgi:proteasome lid subunit RPN8/RPN11
MAKLETIGQVKLPSIHFTRKAMKWITAMVEEHTEEVGWLGIIEETGDYDFTVTEIFYPKHELATGSTCEIDPNGSMELMNKLMDAGRDEDIAKVKLWGHSHHNMGVSPSGQDEKMALEMAHDNGDYLLRIICNKKGDMDVTFYDMSKGLKISDLDYTLDESDDEADVLLGSIKRILDNPDTSNSVKLNGIRAFSQPQPLKDFEYKEIVEKVRELKKVNLPRPAAYNNRWTKPANKKNKHDSYFERFYGDLI